MQIGTFPVVLETTLIVLGKPLSYLIMYVVRLLEVINCITYLFFLSGPLVPHLSAPAFRQKMPFGGKK